jgi:hypothetical protein
MYKQEIDYLEMRFLGSVLGNMDIWKEIIYLTYVCMYVYILMDLREIGWDGVDWIDMAQDRDQWRAVVNTVLNLRVP